MFDDIIGETEKKADTEIVQLFDDENEESPYCSGYPESCEGCERMCSHAW